MLSKMLTRAGLVLLEVAIASCDLVGDRGCLTGSAIQTVCSPQGRVSATLARPGTAPSEDSLHTTSVSCNDDCAKGFEFFIESKTLVCMFSTAGKEVSLAAGTVIAL